MMVSVVVYAQKPDNPAQLIADALSRFGRTELHLSSALVTMGSGEPRCIVTAVNRLDRMMIPRAVLVFADRSAPRQLTLSDDAIAIVGTDNRRAGRLLCGKPNRVVTCGTGLRDTLTLSSSAGDRAVLCAQRRIPTVSGEWLEPCEFAVGLNGRGVNAALIAAGAAAVCGFDLSAQELSLCAKEPWQK